MTMLYFSTKYDSKKLMSAKSVRKTLVYTCSDIRWYNMYTRAKI